MKFMKYNAKKIIFALIWILMNAILVYKITVTKTLGSDFLFHMDYAETIVNTGDFAALNLFTNLLAILIRYLHIPINIAVIGMIVVFQCFYAGIIYYYIHHYLKNSILEITQLFLTFIVCVVTSPINPFAVIGFNVKYIYGNWGSSMTVWHNPTSYMVHPFYILTFFMTCSFIKKVMQDKDKSMATGLTLAVALFISVYAKVSWLQVFAPAILIYLIITWMRSRFDLKIFQKCLLIGIAFLPAGLLGIFTFFAYKDASWSGLIFQFKFFRIQYTALLLALSFPLWVLYCHRKNLFLKLELMLSWLTVFIGYIQIICFTETGVYAGHGNVTWGMSYAMIVLFMVSLIEFIYHEKTNIPAELNAEHPYRSSKVNSVVGYGLIGLYGMSGLLYYAHYLKTGIYTY